MAILDSIQSGDTHGAGTLAFGVPVADGDQLRITNATHTININQSCALGISLGTSYQAMPAVAATGSGGSLPAGTYSVRIAPVSANGITSPSAPSSSIALGAGQVARVTLPALPAGNASWNVYLTEAGGANTTQRRYATGVAPGTFDCTSALWENGTVAYASAASLPFGDALGYTSSVTSHSGGVTVVSGVTITAKGDISILGDFTQAPGTIELDSGAAAAGSYYSIYFGTVYAAGTPKLIQRGTSASARAIIQGKTGTTFGDLRVATQFFASSSMRLDLQWFMFDRLGDGTREGINCVCSAAYNQLMTDGVFGPDCRTPRIQGSPATGGWDLLRVSFRQTDGKIYATRKVCVHLLAGANKTTGLRNLKHCSFEHLPPSLSDGGTVIEDCYFDDQWDISIGGVLNTLGQSIKRCFIRQRMQDAPNGTSSSICSMEAEDNFNYRDFVTGGGIDFNPWGFDVRAPEDGGTRTHTRWVREYNGSASGGDFIAPRSSNAGTVRVTHNLIIPNAAGLTSGNLVTINSQPDTDFFIEIEYNTYVGENGGIMISEGALTPPGMIRTLRSNLCYNPIGAVGGTSSSYMIAKSDMNGANDNFDVAVPTAVDYNTGWNLASVQGQWVGAYSWYNTRFSIAPGAHDVDLGDSVNADLSLFGPQFVDPTRNFQKWTEVVLGATGTQAQKITAGLNALKAIPDPSHANHVPGLVMTAPHTWVRAGWVPQSASLDPTNPIFWAHEGSGFTRGALPHAGSAPPPPPPSGGDKLVMVLAA